MSYLTYTILLALFHQQISSKAVPHPCLTTLCVSLPKSRYWSGHHKALTSIVIEYFWTELKKRVRSRRPSNLTQQEGVGIGFYSPLDVTINTDEVEVLCRTYQMNNFTVHQNSPPYKQVHYMSQNKTGLPLDYIKKLEAVETNGYSGPSIFDDITALKPADKGKACRWYQRKEDEREIT
uniref:Gamma-glutamylcyclotransferase n=1 Tax=Oncorhynchus tshawytscha TaxID=74940 RepID=A0A8C8INA3_ONCTS